MSHEAAHLVVPYDPSQKNIIFTYVVVGKMIPRFVVSWILLGLVIYGMLGYAIYTFIMTQQDLNLTLSSAKGIKTAITKPEEILFYPITAYDNEEQNVTHSKKDEGQRNAQRNLIFLIFASVLGFLYMITLITVVSMRLRFDTT
jgi:hypothetical protein